MNKFAKSLVLALVVAAPIAISAPLFQSAPAAPATMKHHKYHHNHHKSMYKVSRNHIHRHHR